MIIEAAKEHHEMRDLVQQIVGEKLSAITFVSNYYQFQFDGPSFNVWTPVKVLSEKGRAVSGDDQFRNLVCGQIGKVVHATDVRSGEFIELTFVDESKLFFSLLESDYPGPEAVLYTGLDGQWDVL